MAVTWCIIKIRVQSVLPVDRKPNWSAIISLGMAGRSQLATSNFSATRNSRHMGWHGYWASPGDWQTHHSHHPGHQRNSLSVSTPVHSSATGGYGLLPQHNGHRIRSRCSRCLTFCSVFTPAALCWWAHIIIIIIIITNSTRSANLRQGSL